MLSSFTVWWKISWEQLWLNLIYVSCIPANHLEISLLICKAKRNCLGSTWTIGTVENWKYKQNMMICWFFFRFKVSFLENPDILKVYFTKSARTVYRFPFLIASLKVSSWLIFFILFGTKSYIFGPRLKRLSIPLYTNLFTGQENWKLCLKLLGFRILTNKSFTSGGAK